MSKQYLEYDPATGNITDARGTLVVGEITRDVVSDTPIPTETSIPVSVLTVELTRVPPTVVFVSL